jgi:hypothetical protein
MSAGSLVHTNGVGVLFQLSFLTREGRQKGERRMLAAGLITGETASGRDEGTSRDGASRLDAARARAYAVGECRCHTVKTILVRSAALPGRGGLRAAPASPRAPLEHLLARPLIRRHKVEPMELTHQLTPMLRTPRLSGARRSS